ncbi:MAG TPA: MAPEG family protein [Polaromonas sp.]|uniref:MAPEG family protein n=1 Tax=Polaromonas sp. TaxID=1869339 RepID=UPI002D2284C4|nr:MAPEG family protein [Polaromonas sp.]HYW58862.1 MAPEG family protein [Polaromonas sp.]
MTYARFTVAYGCLLVAALLPIICAAIAKFASAGPGGRRDSFDNNNPRDWFARQTGWKARANHAQANTFEALPFFFAAVIIAHQLQASQIRLDVFAFVFVVLRIAYIIMYIADMANTRSVIWFLALLVNIGILFLGYR